MISSLSILIGCLLAVQHHAFPASKSISNSYQSKGEMGSQYFEGDMRFPPRSASSGRTLFARGSSVTWPNGLVPYEFATGYTIEQQNTIVRAMRLLESLVAVNGSVCVQFRPRISTDQYYITIVNGDGCSSYVGMNAGQTMQRTVTLASSGCLSNGTIMHEFYHTLGFYHEQSRPDRDDYITINYANIQDGLASQFQKYDDSTTNTYNYPYDYSSVMHYGAFAFSSNGLPTITPRRNATFGQRNTLSTNDIQVLRTLYNCTVNGVTIPTPTAPTTINIYTANTTARTSLTSSSQRFTRYSGTSGNYYFQAFQVTVPSSGSYRIASMSNIDTFGYLHSTSFNPLATATNLLGWDDDTGSSNQFRMTMSLQANTNYILVVTTYATDVTGNVTVLVSGLTGVTITPININAVSATQAPTTTMNNGVSTSYSSTLSASSSIFTRSGSSGTFYFEAVQVTVTTGGTYTFQSGSGMDDYGYLYQGSFSSSSPGNNIITSDDDSGGSNRFRFSQSLQAGTTYILVITTYGSGSVGSISVTVSGPAQVSLTRLNTGSGSSTPTSTTVRSSTTTATSGPSSTYSSTLTSYSSIFTRSGGAGSFYFEAIQVTVITSGTYTFQSGSNMDDYGYLYQGSFNPSSPGNNIITSDDDSGGSNRFRFSQLLQAGTTYILVITTYGSGSVGSISVTVTGPAQVTLTRLTVASGSTTTTARTTTTTQPSSSYSSTLSTSSSTFTRSGSSGTFYFEAIQVTVTTSGTYTFQSGSSMDDYGYLYQGSFDPSSPGSNIIASDDDSGGSNRFRFSQSLQAGTTYILVMTTFSGGSVGSISVTVTGPAQVTLTRVNRGSGSSTPTPTTTRPTTTLPTTLTPTYSGSLSTSSSTFTRSGAAGTFYYEAMQVTITTSGTYTFQSGSNMDDYGYLYQGSFNPSSPGNNIIASDDDSGGSYRFRFTVTLQAGVTYILVFTTYGPELTGAFSVSITGPAQVTVTRFNAASASTTTTARTSTTVSPTSSYSSTLSTSSSTFTRSGGAGTFYFEAIQVTVTTSGTYTFQSGSSMDDYGYLYQGSFNPSSSGSNIIASDDDSGGSNRFRFSQSLQAGTTYILVITTFSSGSVGSISVTVTGPAQVTLARLNVGSGTTSTTTTTAPPITTTLPNTSYSSALTNSSSRFTRSGSSGSFFYEALQVTISVNGTYTFLSGSSMDDFGYLYQNSFSVTSPGNNIIASDDDSGGSLRFRLSLFLQAGRTYILVMTTYSNGVTGSISVTVTGPARVTLTRLTTSSASG